MRLTSLKTTTAITMALSVLAPTAFAQGQGLPDCGEGAGTPCVIADTGAQITPADLANLPVCDMAAETVVYPCATAEGDVLTDPDADIVESADEPVGGAAETPAGADVVTDAPQDAPADAAAEPPVTPEASIEPVEPVESTDEDAAIVEEQAAPEVEAGVESGVEADVAVEAEEPAVPEVGPVSDAEVAADPVAEDAPAAIEATPDAAVAAESAEPDEPVADAPAAAPAAAPEVAPEVASEPAVEPVAEPEMEAVSDAGSGDAAQPAEDAEAEALRQALEAAQGEQSGTQPESGAAADAGMAEPSAAAAAAAAVEEAPAAAAAAAAVEEAPSAAAAAESETPAEGGTEGATQEAQDSTVVIEEETVTEESARSSTEEFETKVETAAAARDSGRKARNEDDDGLSAFEKALITGLGAIAVGQLLDNGDEVVSNTGDRVVVLRDGEYRVLKDDDTLLRQPGSDIRTERFSDGSTRETVTREDGVQIVTIRGADGRVLRRMRVLPDGQRVLLFDDTQTAEPVIISELPQQEAGTITLGSGDELALQRALEQALATDTDRRFSLRQVRDIRQVRELAPQIEVDAITFESGSSAIRPDQARELASLGTALRNVIAERPYEVFLIEGHTDAVGAEEYNLALSDRRAETVALALSEYFDVPPENLVVQGYGETSLKVRTEDAERANRRAVVRRITNLLRVDLASGDL